MQMQEIQRQYDEVIASHYDFDPQSVIGDSLNRAVQQIARQVKLDGRKNTRKILDLGLGTGRFVEMLRASLPDPMEPYGIDISEKMIAIAHSRIPDLVTMVDDVENMETHFPEFSFDLIATHFVTGFVPMQVLAPKIAGKLQKNGLWSFVGGTKAGFPALQRKTRTNHLFKLLFRIKTLDVGKLVCNPADEDEVKSTLARNGFSMLACETFTPRVHFKNLDEFLEFAYYGGWLTPFVESFGIHKAKPALRAILNGFFFPVQDHHCVVIALAQKN